MLQYSTIIILVIVFDQSKARRPSTRERQPLLWRTAKELLHTIDALAPPFLLHRIH